MKSLAAAIDWGVRGFRVFPTRGKEPLTSGDWREVATSDPYEIMTLGRWAEADGFGVALDDCMVVDLDAHEHPIEDALREYGQLAPDAEPTLSVRTPSGGVHLYYQCREPLSQRSPAPGKIDIRAPGRGYVCGPGIGGYELLRDQPPAPLPPSLLAFCRDRGPERVEDRTPVVDLDQPEAVAAAWDMLRREPPNTTSGEDAYRYRLACRLFDHGLSEEAAAELLHRWNETLAAYPRPAAEINKAVSNASRYARLPPGQRWHERQETIRALLDHAGVPAEERAEGPNLADALTQRLRDAGLLLTARSIQDIAAMPPPRWFVPGWVLAEGVTAIYGPPKRGKTFAALDLALSAAHGRDWLGQAPIADHEGTVVYLCLERPAEAWARVLAWCEFYEVEPSDRFLFLDGSAVLSTVEAVEALRDALAAIPGGVSLVLVDTLARAMLGSEEQSSKETGLALHALEMLGRSVAAPVVVVHHSGKDASKGMRGSSAILAAVAAAISSDMEDGRLTLTVEETSRGRGGAVMSAIASGNPEHPVFTPTSVEPDAPPEPISHGDRIVTAVIAAAASEPETGSARLVPMSDFVHRLAATAHGVVPAARARAALYWAMERYPSLRELVLAGEGQAAVYPASYRGTLARKAGVMVAAEGLTDPP